MLLSSNLNIWGGCRDSGLSSFNHTHSQRIQQLLSRGVIFKEPSLSVCYPHDDAILASVLDLYLICIQQPGAFHWVPLAPSSVQRTNIARFRDSNGTIRKPVKLIVPLALFDATMMISQRKCELMQNQRKENLPRYLMQTRIRVHN